MSETRRNLSIMGLVVALTIAAGAAVAVKGSPSASTSAAGWRWS